MSSDTTAKSPTTSRPQDGAGPSFDWSTTVRPLLGATYGNIQPLDLVKLAKCIESSRDQIMNHDAEFEPFYSLFVALSTHHLCSNAASVPKANLNTVVNACRVLAEFILNRLEKPYAHCSVMPKQFVLLVKGLCKGLGFLQRSDVITLAALLKSSQLPPHIRATIGAEKLSEEEGPSSKSREKKRPTTIVNQPVSKSETPMTGLIDFLSVFVPPDSIVENVKNSSKPTTPTDMSKDIKEQFVSECMQHLARLNAGSILIDVCLKLPFLARYNIMFRELLRGENPFTEISQTECQSIFDSHSSFLNDMIMVSRVVMLPLMEPLTPERLSKLCSLACTCLLAACTVTIAYHKYSPKSEPDASSLHDLEAFVSNIVEKSLVIFSTILNTVQGSTSIGGTQLQNMRALGAWCIASGLNRMLRTFDMNGAIVGLAQQFLTLVQPLFYDLKADVGKSEMVTELVVNSVLTPWQRFEYVNRRCKILPVLLTIAHDSYLKGAELIRESRANTKPGAVDPAGSNKIPHIDMEPYVSQPQSVPNTPSESDSEPLLGSWLEELLSSVPQMVTSAVKQSAGILHGGRRRTTGASESSMILGIKEDANTFVSLAVSCLRAINDDLLYGYRMDTDVLKKSISTSWTEREVGYLATMIRSMDSQIDTGNAADESLLEFSTTLMKFVHNLIANGLLGDALETCLLAKLDIAIGAQYDDSDWPLYLSPCLAGILCQLLLLKQNKQRDESGGGSEIDSDIVRIWTRFLASLKKNVFKEHDHIDIIDVNIEHLQVLLALFHSMQINEKKRVLLEICKTITDVVKENRSNKFLNANVSSHFARLLLIFDYMLLFFSDPPPDFLKQLKTNVFPIQMFADDQQVSLSCARLVGYPMEKAHFACAEIEALYRIESSSMQQVKQQPFFYNLTPNKDVESLHKVDSLGATFIQAASSYNDLYEACCEMTNFFDRFRPNDHASLLQRGVLRYSGKIIWRILKMLQPSARFLEEIASWNSNNAPDIPTHKSRVFLLFISTKLVDTPGSVYHNWMKDGMIKQGRTAAQADEYAKNVFAKHKDAPFMLELIAKSIEKTKRHWIVDTTDTNVNDFPSFTDMVYVNLLVCRAAIVLDQSRQSITPESIPIVVFKNVLVDLLDAARSLVIEQAVRCTIGQPFPSSALARTAGLKLMSICGNSHHSISTHTSLMWQDAQESLKSKADSWNLRSLANFPAFGTWAGETVKLILPVDKFISTAHGAHLDALSSENWSIAESVTVKEAIETCFSLFASTISSHPTLMPKDCIEEVLAPIVFDVLTSKISNQALATITVLNDGQEEALHSYVLPIIYDIIVKYAFHNDGAFDSKVSVACLLFVKSNLDNSAGRSGLVHVLNNAGGVRDLLLTRPDAKLAFTSGLVRLLGSIFETAELVKEEKEFQAFCGDVMKSFTSEPELLQQLLNRVFLADEEKDTNRSTVMKKCCRFLEAVAKSANRSQSPSIESIEISRVLLETIIPVMTAVLSTNCHADSAEENGPFSHLFAAATRIASIGRGFGHRELFKAAVDWMKLCTSRMSTDESLAHIKSCADNPTLRMLSEAASTILSYMSGLIEFSRPTVNEPATTISYDSDASGGEQEADGVEEFAAQPDEDESGGEDSDDDALDTKLCTFTVTQKEFMNQHWYHCHSCSMVDGEGVCTVCAKVCHKGHDLSYSKYGSFFCDCGAKGESNCQALAKRTKKTAPKSTPQTIGGDTGENSAPGLRRSQSKSQTKSKGKAERSKSNDDAKKSDLFYGDERDREELLTQLKAAGDDIVKIVTDFIGKVGPAVSTAAESNSSIGNLAKLRQSLKELHDCDSFRFDTVETLAAPSGGSQENAFENTSVKTSFSGDQGQTIKQLLTNHILHRAVLACASSQNKRKQFLAVVHDRCKIAILQLASFLKQVDNGKKKLTMTRSVSDSFAFTILSISENPVCEDYIAVCGLRDCVVVTLSQTGAITDRLNLTLGMDVGNFIIKALWLPGSTTEIALVTADFVRVYDLTKNTSAPEYDFLLPAGKIRDATFICRDSKTDTSATIERYLVLMTSNGYVYGQVLGDHCRSLIHGPFYITDVLEITHPELEESNGNLSGGGVSIYYSHSLQLLFASYANGKNLFASLDSGSGLGTIKRVNMITWKSGQKSMASQALCRWNEVQGHAGVVLALTNTSQTPIVIFIRPQSILVQEITLPPKAKVLDALLCRNGNASDESVSSVLLLCEDGSMRTVGINKDLTNFWIKKPSTFRFPVLHTAYRPRSKRAWRGDRAESAEFPVDFFEGCQQLMDVEFGGADLLQIYNAQQLRNRLQTTNLYVVSAKTGGFQVELINRESGMVICGVRIELGKHNYQKAPSYVEIFGRRRSITLTHSRWIDLPFAKEESISAGTKVVVTFGPTADPSGHTIVDSIKVYGKSKEAFGWPDDIDEELPTMAMSAEARALSTQASSSGGDDQQQFAPKLAAAREIGELEKTIKCAFDTLAVSLAAFSKSSSKFESSMKELSLKMLITLNHPDTIRSAKAILRRLSSGTEAYYSMKDAFILKYVMNGLKSSEVKTDPELFSFLVSLTRNIAINRPKSLFLVDAGNEALTLLKIIPEAFWRLLKLDSPYPSISAVGSVEMENLDGLVRAIVDIVHGHCVADVSLTPVVVKKSLIEFLMSENLQISAACRQAICWIYRRKTPQPRPFLGVLKPPMPPKIPNPTMPTYDFPPSPSLHYAQQPQAAQPQQQQQQQAPPPPQHPPMEPPPYVLMGDEEPLQAIPPNALMVEEDTDGEQEGDGGDHVYEIHADGDEEAMMELAIALSLQDQTNAGAANVAAAANVVDNNYPPSVSVQEESLDAGQMSDTTGSGLSDDEGSTAATEGSTLRISPSDDRVAPGSATAASDSAGSGAESGSGRSSNDGEAASASQVQMRASSSSLPRTASGETESESKKKNHKLLLAFLDSLTDELPRLNSLNGVQCISYMQVVTSLLNSLTCTDAAEKKLVTKLLERLLADMKFTAEAAAAFCQRSAHSEVTLIKLRFLTVLLSRAKGRSRLVNEADIFICSNTAGALVKRGVLDFILAILKNLLQNAQPSETPSAPNAKVLPLKADNNPPDLAPFFLRPYVKEHSRDVFESYTQLVTEMAMRLPYQVKKVADLCRSSIPPLQFDDAWNSVLCEFLRSEQSTFVKKYIRKLFMFICGSKEKYRQMRDVYSLEFDLKAVKALFAPAESTPGRHPKLDYVNLNLVMDHLKTCSDIASSRPGNWQKFCVMNTELFCYLLQLSVVVDDNIASTILSLLLAAVSSPYKDPKKKEIRKEEIDRFRFADKQAAMLAEALLSNERLPVLIASLRRFLFECNTAERRWQMHGFVRALFGCIDATAQQRLLDILWKDLWPDVPHHGRKAVQFVDLLGYYTLTLANPQKIASYAGNVLALLKTQNHMLSEHANANVYNALASLLEFDGYYLESNPCLVCNNPEIPMTNLKLSSIKMDARYTTSSQILKLVGSHEISKITLKISEMRRSKMVKRLSLYYSNKSVQSAVELKNRPDLWTLAKRFNLAQSQTELKMEFAVPIVACNLVMEYSEFFETPMTASEMMHCPRCSASVPAHPGVCTNCGENVYQCHKCRAINYDERDPFLCNACGYSKYGKFDYTVTARPVAGVEPIENEEDRKRVFTLIDTLLGKADQIYRQLQINRQQIESALARISGQDLSAEEPPNASPLTSNPTAAQLTSTGAMGFVAKNIQQVALRYNRDCRTSFDELSKVVQKIIANRAELVEYDRRQRESFNLPPGAEKLRSLQSSPKCFGCAAASAQHCILLIRGMTSSASATSKLITSQKELMKELIDVAVKQTSARARQAARELVCSIIHDQEDATDMVCNHITQEVTRALSEPKWSTAVVTNLVQVELHLLSASLQLMDKCWERRLRCALELFVKSTQSPSGAVAEAITMPLLQMLQSIILVPPFVSNQLKGKALADAASVASADGAGAVRVTLDQYLLPDGSKPGSTANPPSSCETYSEWLEKQSKSSNPLAAAIPRLEGAITPEQSWLERALFCPNSIQLRSTAASIFKQICSTTPGRKTLVLDLLTRHLNQISRLGDRAHEFVALYQTMIEEEKWKLYVAQRGVLSKISKLLLMEMEKLKGLESTTLATDIAQGYTIKVLTDILLSIVDIEKVRKKFKSQLLSPVLHSYLALRSIVVQRTKLIDDAQAKLLQLLELLTTGTESETKEFMTICIDTVKRCPPDDVRTPVFIFERLCSIIYPEEKEVGEFLINIEKDPAQEDFLQGRMAGNPYRSADSGMGPLMRDIKNKICRDCELFSLLEDDTGMELLAGGKIISLDLPVVEVYKKVWQPQHNGEPMMVMYRMRGLLGDATEEFIETLAPKKGEKINEEEVFRLSGVMSECGGIEVMLERLTAIKNIASASSLLSVLLSLFEHCVKVKRNRMKLIEPQLNAVPKFLACLTLILSKRDASLLPYTEKILQILDRIVNEANELPDSQFEDLFGKMDTSEDFEYLLKLIVDDQATSIGPIKDAMLRTLPNLSLGSSARIVLLIDYFQPFANFETYDSDPSPKSSSALDSFCALTKGIVLSKYGGELKQRLIDAGFLNAAMKHLIDYCPPLFKIGSTIDSIDWKEFLARPSLKYVLRLLAGLARGHEPSQTAIAKDCIPIIHRMEQISSEEHLGTLAEAVMEALRENPSVTKRIMEVREETRAKKKQLAMAMRQKQLGEMGMKIGEKGLVRVESGVLKDANLHEETGLVCSICQEGYTAAPHKALGIYTFTKRVNAEEYETKGRKMPAYTTVTHFNVIHLECHQTAVRSAPGRDEWESGMLHNANTRCNGLLPLWGPNVSESEYAGHLSRHNQYIQEQTGVADIGFSTTVHDLKLLLNRFAHEKSFADESGGGGRSSNIRLIPYLTQLSLYVMISSNQVQSQTKALQTYMASRVSDWVGLSFDSEGHVYYCVLAFLLNPPIEWKRMRLDLLKRMIITAQSRHVARGGASKTLSDTTVKEYAAYKPYLLIMALVDGFYKYLYQDVKCENATEWPLALQNYIRQNDSKLGESTAKLVKYFEEELLPCENVGEFLDVCGLLTDIPNVDEFMSSALATVASTGN